MVGIFDTVFAVISNRDNGPHQFASYATNALPGIVAIALVLSPFRNSRWTDILISFGCPLYFVITPVFYAIKMHSAPPISFNAAALGYIMLLVSVVLSVGCDYLALTTIRKCFKDISTKPTAASMLGKILLLIAVSIGGMAAIPLLSILFFVQNESRLADFTSHIGDFTVSNTANSIALGG
jgi:hypothetical protein